MTNTRRATCVQCSGPMPLMHRSDRKHCSRSCEAKAYRGRNGAGLRLPKELTSCNRWVRHNDRKVPLTAEGRPASSTDPVTWASYRAAKASSVGVGMGFVLDGDGIVCVDLDHALDEQGRPLPWARQILDELPSTFVEVSRSGRGLHVFGRGPAGPGRKVRRADGVAVEWYSRGRYIAVTGRRFEDAPLKLADLSGVDVDLL